MHPIHDDSALKSNSMNADIAMRRLEREKSARKEAESLLERKSRELFEANQTLKLTASSLENQRLQLNTILDHTPAGICLAQSDFSAVRANPVALYMFGLDGQDFKVSDLFSDWESAERMIENASSSEASAHQNMAEAVGRRKDGSEFPMEFGLAKMDHLGWDRAVWIFKDITVRKRAELKRAALERELGQTHKMEALGTLASGVAHEINTPIQYVSDNMRFLADTMNDLAGLIEKYKAVVAEAESAGIAQDLTDAAKGMETDVDLSFLLEEAPEAIAQSLQGATQVATIVNAIKEFSHPGEDQKVSTDLNKLIETTLTVTRNQWKYVAEIETQLADDLPEISCMPSEISQVVLNLIVNAADAIGSGNEQGRGHIHITTTCDDENVEINIQDDGPGMTSEILDRIFDPFFTTKDVGKGSGQGLAIAYSIINQKHAGIIRCSSEPGKGACFSVRLPIDAKSNEEG